MTMKSDKRPVIGLICVMLSCILVIGVTIGLLGSVNIAKAVAGSTTDTGTPEESAEDEPELQWGYKSKYIDGTIVDGASPCLIAYKSEKNTFDINEVKLTVSYGILNGFGMKHLGGDYSEFEIGAIFMNDQSLDVIDVTIKKIEGDIFSEEFKVIEIIDSDNDLEIHEFNHSEEITISKEFLLGGKGTIFIGVRGVRADGLRFFLCQEPVGYKIKGTEVVLLSGLEIFDRN